MYAYVSSYEFQVHCLDSIALHTVRTHQDGQEWEAQRFSKRKTNEQKKTRENLLSNNFHPHHLSFISNSRGNRSTFGIRLLIPIPLSRERGRHLELTANWTCQSSPCGRGIRPTTRNGISFSIPDSQEFGRHHESTSSSAFRGRTKIKPTVS